MNNLRSSRSSLKVPVTLPYLLVTNLRSEGLVARDTGGVIRGNLVVVFRENLGFLYRRK